MKYRNGFVSNSSSSSFIIGVALVPSDRIEEAKKLLDDWSVELHEIPDAIERGKGWSNGYVSSRDCYEVESFNYDSVSVGGVAEAYAKDQGTQIFVLSGCGDEPQYDEDSWEYNYDEVDEDWFSKHQQEAAAFIDSLGGHWTYGAGFNG